MTVCIRAPRTLFQAIAPSALAPILAAPQCGVRPGSAGEQVTSLYIARRHAEMIARSLLVPLYGGGAVLSLSIDAMPEGFDIDTVAYGPQSAVRVPVAALPEIVLRTPAQLVSVFRPRQAVAMAPPQWPPAAILDGQWQMLS